MKRIIALVFATALANWPGGPLCAVSKANPQSELAGELRLCRNSPAAADRIAHCSNVIAQPASVAALVTAHNTRGLALMEIAGSTTLSKTSHSLSSEVPKSQDISTIVRTHSGEAGVSMMRCRTRTKRSGWLPPIRSLFTGERTFTLPWPSTTSLSSTTIRRFASRQRRRSLHRAGQNLPHPIGVRSSHCRFLPRAGPRQKVTDAYRERGLTYRLMGRSQDALDDLTAFERLQPGDPDVGRSRSIERESFVSARRKLRLNPLRRTWIRGACKRPPPDARRDVSRAGHDKREDRTRLHRRQRRFDGRRSGRRFRHADPNRHDRRCGSYGEAELYPRRRQHADAGDVSHPLIEIGDRVLHDVDASVAPIAGNLLLGQSFCRFKSWSMDNQRGLLVLNYGEVGRKNSDQSGRSASTLRAFRRNIA